MAREIIVSSSVSIRNRDKRLLKEQQNKQMQLKQVEQNGVAYKNTQSAFADKHIAEALKKVQQSDVTIDKSYSRFQGSSLYTESIGQSLKKVERNALRKIRKTLPKHEPTNAVSIKEPIEKSKSSKQSIEETLWQRVCRQVNKPRLTANTLFESTNRYGVNVRTNHKRNTKRYELK